MVGTWTLLSKDACMRWFESTLTLLFIFILERRYIMKNKLKKMAELAFYTVVSVGTIALTIGIVGGVVFGL